MLLFTDQIFKKSLRQKAQQSLCLKTRGRLFQPLIRWAFETLRENQEPDREFQKFGRVFKKLIRVIKKFGHAFAL